MFSGSCQCFSPSFFILQRFKREQIDQKAQTNHLQYKHNRTKTESIFSWSYKKTIKQEDFQLGVEGILYSCGPAHGTHLIVRIPIIDSRKDEKIFFIFFKFFHMYMHLVIWEFLHANLEKILSQANFWHDFSCGMNFFHGLHVEILVS